jgi:DNA-binding transcriptional LysR family regulator
LIFGLSCCLYQEADEVKSRLDLNLLPIAVALYEQRGVSKAAAQLGMSQPAVSAALARLRKAFSDPLFIRTAQGMAPTARAHAIIGHARDVLARVDGGLLSGLAFDPANASGTFAFALSDVGEMVFLPRILERMQKLAPMASIRSVSLPPPQLRHALENGEVDLAIGYFPDLAKTNFFQQRLFDHHFSCLMRADHPIASKRLTLKQFLSMQHVVVRAEGRSQELFERFLAKKRVRPKIALFTPHFTSLPIIIAKSDLVATVPHAIGMFFSGSWTNIKTALTPFPDAPRIPLRQHWHRKTHYDQRSQWLRRIVSELFNEESDEWTKTRRR